MSQQTLYDYFDSPKKSVSTKSSFFSLPFSIRRRIYLTAGLGSRRFIVLNYWQGSRFSESDLVSYEQEHKCPAEPRLGKADLEADSLPTSLLYVSRAIHSEVEKLLYSENEFVVSSRGPGGLQALAKLSQNAVKELRSITVRLEPCLCITPSCSVTQWPRRPARREFWQCSHPQHDRSLGDIARSDRSVITQWQQICARFSEHAKPKKVKLYLICPVSSIALARKVLQPLSSLPVLCECGISLGGCRESNLQDLARKTALILMGKSHLLKPFRFFDLPDEIQLQILEHTPLVSAVKLQAYEWNSKMRYYWKDPRNYPLTEDQWNDIAVYPIHFCCRELAGLNLRCACYSFLSAYYLVSRRFGSMARKVFFSKNQFVLHPWDPWWCPDTPFHSPAPSLELHDELPRPNLGLFVDYLDTLAPESLGMLTSITFVFPPMDHTYLAGQAPPWVAWLRAVDLLVKHANSPGLTIELHMSDIYISDSDELQRRHSPNER